LNYIAFPAVSSPSSTVNFQRILFHVGSKLKGDPTDIILGFCFEVSKPFRWRRNI